LAAVLMSPRKDCFAVFTPHQMEPHYSMYLSLFGRDLQVGEKAAARCRLVVGPALSTAEVSALTGKYQ
jgi:hypothetical protein